jgi:anti-sigma factor (TIGR02949 family)
MVLEHVQEFLDNELDSATEEAVRAHIAICEQCLDQAEVWMAVKTLVKRACPTEVAPETVVSRVSLRVSSLRIEKRA